MLIDEKNYEKTKEHLLDHFKRGYKWVAFPYYNEQLDKSNLHCFKEFSSVASHCEKNVHYFKPIASVLRAIQPEVQQTVKPVDTEKLGHEIARFPIEPFKKSEDLITGLKSGELYPVLLNRKIDPAIEVLNYKIFEHTHPGHQVYEIGHELGLVGSFQNYKEAATFFDQHLSKCSELPERSKPDLTMIAELKHEKPKLDVEGMPMHNSALLLKIANPSWNADKGTRIYDVKDWQSINSLSVKQPCLAKFNTQSSQLEFFDGKLQKFQLGEKIDYMPLACYSTKEVNVSNAAKESLNPKDLSDSLNESKKNNQKIGNGL